jgi:hypothetical protein
MSVKEMIETVQQQEDKMKKYAIMVSWSVSDYARYLVEANNVEEAQRKIKARFSSAHIDGIYELESEVIR